MKKTLPLIQKISSVLACPPEQRARAIIDAENTAEIMSNLSPQDAFLVIKESWETDGQVLLSFVPPDQLNYFLDLDCWQTGAVDRENLVEWLWSINEQGSEYLGQALDHLDLEMLIILFQNHVHITHASPVEDNIPDLIDGGYETADNVYFYRFTEDQPQNEMLRLIIKTLFAKDHDLYRRLLEGVGWEPEALIAEQAEHNRSLRLMEMGFPTAEEAVKVYRRQDPGLSLGLDARTTPILTEGEYAPPALYHDHLKNCRDLIVTTMETAPEQTRERCIFEMVYLTNKLVMADFRPVGDTDELAGAAAKARGMASLGLELTARQTGLDAAAVLAQQNVETLFARAFSSLLSLQHQLRRSLDREDWQLIPAKDRDLFDGLMQPRPVIAGEISLAAHDRAADLVIRVTAMKTVLDRSSWKDALLANTNAAATTGLDLENIILTALAVNSLSGETRFRPLSTEEFHSFIARVTEVREGLRRVVPAFATDLSALLRAYDPAMEEAQARTTADGLALRLGEELQGLSDMEHVDPRFVTCIVVNL